MKLTILGCGTSAGVPRIGNDWGRCDPAEPRNRRSRASITVEADGKRILVDTGPDLRQQLLDTGIDRVDHVIWTHEHSDHCHGIDELRQLYFAIRTPIPCYARPRTLSELQQRFSFAFKGIGAYPPYAAAQPLLQIARMANIAVTAADMPHGGITTAALRFEHGGKSIAYTTDFTSLPAQAAECVRGVDVWVVDALRRREHPTHPNLAQTLEWIAQYRPGRAILTHMDNSMDYATLRAELPAHVEPGYDGMEIVL